MMWVFRSVYAMLAYTGIIVYTGLRLFAFIKLFRPAQKRRFFWLFYIFLSYSFFFLAVLQFDRIGFFHIAGMYLPFIFIYLFAFIFLFDMLSLVLRFWRRKRLKKGIPVGRATGIMPQGVGAALLLTMFLLIYGSFHARDIKTVHYNLDYNFDSLGFSAGEEIFFSKPKTNIRIVLVSDLHIGEAVGKTWVRKIVDRINENVPDMVCLAGDIFNSGIGGITDPEDIAAELKRIKAPLGIYACLGNHDTNRRTRSIDGIGDFLIDAGIILLADETVLAPFSAGKPDIVIIGRKDSRPIGMQDRRQSIQEFFDQDFLDNTGSGIAPRPFLIALDHQPIDLPQAARAGIDLVLCGHTHRGQFFPGNLFTWFIYKKAGGTHYGRWHMGNTQAIVTSGVGIWGPPIRIGTNSEIAVIDVQF